MFAPFWPPELSAETPGITLNRSAVLFGAVALPDGRLLIYYGSADTRLMVAESSIARMVDYCFNTPPDGLRSAECVRQRLALIASNAKLKT